MRQLVTAQELCRRSVCNRGLDGRRSQFLLLRRGALERLLADLQFVCGLGPLLLPLLDLGLRRPAALQLLTDALRCIISYRVNRDLLLDPARLLGGELVHGLRAPHGLFEDGVCELLRGNPEALGGLVDAALGDLAGGLAVSHAHVPELVLVQFEESRHLGHLCLQSLGVCLR